jgi:hypothetical protein
MQQEPLQEQMKDPRSAAQGKIGGQIRMAQLNSQERSALAKYAARARWHPREAQAAKERAEELARVVKQAIDAYVPSDKRHMMEP